MERGARAGGGGEEWWCRAVCGRVSEETEALEEALLDRIVRNVSSQRSGLVPPTCKERLNDKGKVDTSEEYQ